MQNVNLKYILSNINYFNKLNMFYFQICFKELFSIIEVSLTSYIN